MLKLLASTILLFLASSLLVGQEKATDSPWKAFNGTWRFKESSGADFLPLPKDTIWIISTSASEITIHMEGYPFRLNSRYTLILDDQTLNLRPGLDGEVNTVRSTPVKSKTTWNKDLLTREYETKVTLPPGSGPSHWIEEVTERFSLSKKGDRLTFECTSKGNIPQATEDRSKRPASKAVFDRKE